MTTLVHLEEIRLRALFASILPLTLGVSATACSKTSPPAPNAEHVAPLEASVHEAGAREASVREATVPHDAGVDPCKPVLAHLMVGTVDGAAECLAVQRLACGPPADVHAVDGGCSFTVADCQRLCPSFGAARCWAGDASCGPSGLVSGPVLVSCDFCPGGIGRRPDGLLESPRDGASGLGAYFAKMARLEAASVIAFVELARALTREGAPPELVGAASRALADERRHARKTARLARRFHARPAAVRVAPPRRAPSLEAIALENAVEGCVRETYGALVAWFSSARATDPEIAQLMREIAEDETRHAALSYAIHAWAMGRLSPGQQARIEAAQRDAIAALCAEITEPSPELERVAGVPGSALQRRLQAAFASAAATA